MLALRFFLKERQLLDEQSLSRHATVDEGGGPVPIGRLPWTKDQQNPPPNQVDREQDSFYSHRFSPFLFSPSLQFILTDSERKV